MPGSFDRKLDQYEHQQTTSATDEQQREEGGHLGPVENGYQGKLGAAGAQIRHSAGAYEDHTFTAIPTVSVAQTQQPVQYTDGGVGSGLQAARPSQGIKVLCGPLLNYRRMSGENTGRPVWHGSVLLVTRPGSQQPQLRLRIKRSPGGAETLTGSATFARTVKGEKLYEDPKGAFWRFVLELPFQAHESTWEYDVPNAQNVSKTTLSSSDARSFSIPAKSQSMRIMFHSCNGFSAGTDTDAWSGCALWNDVLRVHAKKPFHVMIGGGDQIYNDGVQIDGPLKPWTDLGNPKKRRDFPFNEQLRAQCDEYYYDNYVRWYSTEPFAEANGQIPQLNMWDDHDIIDGFGSYTDHFMRSPVFRGIGGIAHKYYLLFQHHIPPPASTYTTDAPSTTHANRQGTTTADAVQMRDSWVLMPKTEDPSFIIGKEPGPYVEERSRSLYCQLGARVAFVGIDARTERTRRQVNYPHTYDLIFQRAEAEISAARGGIKHLILLLGVPIAYPRMQWLENVFHSPVIGPIRFLNKRFGVAGSFFNQFDGQIELMDDLDDHYTSRQHKKERSDLILRLQALAKKHSLRVTILGGDVHLAALGRFYSNPKLNIATEKDWRYMPNIISSAITNKPPPSAVANLLAKRNKIHHLDENTDETLLNIFDQDPGHGKSGVKNKTANTNHCTMPSRNYAIITESGAVPAMNGVDDVNGDMARSSMGDVVNAMNGMNGTSMDGGLDMNGTDMSTNGLDVNSTGTSTNGLDIDGATSHGLDMDGTGMSTNGTNGTNSMNSAHSVNLANGTHHSLTTDTHDSTTFDHSTHANANATNDEATTSINTAVNTFPASSHNHHLPGTTHDHRLPGTTHGTAGARPTAPHTHHAIFAPFKRPANPRHALHVGEHNAGTAHPAADGLGTTTAAAVPEELGSSGLNALAVTLRVEIDPGDGTGRTQGYGFMIPALWC